MTDLQRCLALAKVRRDQAGACRGTAADAWSRDLAYAQLDRTAATLARRLAARTHGRLRAILATYGRDYSTRRAMAGRTLGAAR